MPEGFKSTVAIPLHHGSRWIDVVAANLERLEGVAQIIVSDPFEEDDTLERLRKRFADRSSIEWRGRRPLAPGWVPHLNDLLANATTPYFMWLPQDDEIDATWIREGEELLVRNCDAVIAVGALRAIRGTGLFYAPRCEIPLEFEDPDRRTRLHAAGRCLLVHTQGLAVAFRGLFRTENAAALPLTSGQGAWSDLYWVCSMLVSGPFVRMPSAEYAKRYRIDGTHLGWGNYYEIAEISENVSRYVEFDRSISPVEDLAAVASGLQTAVTRHTWRLRKRFWQLRKQFWRLSASICRVRDRA